MSRPHDVGRRLVCPADGSALGWWCMQCLATAFTADPRSCKGESYPSTRCWHTLVPDRSREAWGAVCEGRFSTFCSFPTLGFQGVHTADRLQSCRDCKSRIFPMQKDIREAVQGCCGFVAVAFADIRSCGARCAHPVRLVDHLRQPRRRSAKTSERSKAVSKSPR